MPITATVSINVPALPENDIWFANSASWSNYWADITANVEIDPVTTTVYASSPYDDNLEPHTLNVDGVETVLATNAMFESLKLELQTLNAAFQTMRTQLRNAGLITQAQ